MHTILDSTNDSLFNLCLESTDNDAKMEFEEPKMTMTYIPDNTRYKIVMNRIKKIEKT